MFGAWRPAVDDGEILFRLFGVTDVDCVAFAFIENSFVVADAVVVSEVNCFIGLIYGEKKQHQNIVVLWENFSLAKFSYQNAYKLCKIQKLNKWTNFGLKCIKSRKIMCTFSEIKFQLMKDLWCILITEFFFANSDSMIDSNSISENYRFLDYLLSADRKLVMSVLIVDFFLLVVNCYS